MSKLGGDDGRLVRGLVLVCIVQGPDEDPKLSCAGSDRPTLED